MALYTCDQCKRNVGIVRFDCDSDKRKPNKLPFEVCDKCYWSNYNERNISNTRSK